MKSNISHAQERIVDDIAQKVLNNYNESLTMAAQHLRIVLSEREDNNTDFVVLLSGKCAVTIFNAYSQAVMDCTPQEGKQRAYNSLKTIMLSIENTLKKKHKVL